MTNQVTYGCLGRKLKSYYLREEGLTKPPVSALVQNLSHSTYGWKDEPSHSRVPWSKLKSSYFWVERMNQATNNCLGTKFKSFYLRVEGRTKSLTSDSVQNLSPFTDRWKNEPSHSQVPWSKFKSFYLQWKDEPSHQQVPWYKI